MQIVNDFNISKGGEDCMITVFLGGTCNGSTWRDELMPMLESEKISAFNPVVEHWDEKAQAEEDFHKENDDIMLYVFTPEFKGIYSAFEVAMLSCKNPGSVVCCILNERDGKTYEPHVQKNMKKIKKDLLENGTLVLDSLEEVANYLNSLEKKNKDEKIIIMQKKDL